MPSVNAIPRRLHDPPMCTNILIQRLSTLRLFIAVAYPFACGVTDTWKMINRGLRKGDINYTRTVWKSGRVCTLRRGSICFILLEPRRYCALGGEWSFGHRWSCWFYSLRALLLSWHYKFHFYPGVIICLAVCSSARSISIHETALIRWNYIWIKLRYSSMYLFGAPVLSIICDSCLKYKTGVYYRSVCSRQRGLINPKMMRLGTNVRETLIRPLGSRGIVWRRDI